MCRARPLSLLLTAAPLCAAHFQMNKPPSWLDRDGDYVWAGGNSVAGCTGKAAPGQAEAAQGCVEEWYSNYTFIPGEPTIPPLSPLLTYKDACMGNVDTWSGQHSEPCCNPACKTVAAQSKGGACEGCDWSRKMPWRAPGSAPVFSPCGVDGGNPNGCPAGNPNGDQCAGGGYGHGPDGRTLKGNTKPESWTAGGEAEVAWGVTANHGGGYQYRLCPKPAAGYSALTEECFQRMPLRFVGSTQWLQKGADTSVRTAIAAVRTDVGTVPPGSQWTRNPLPACGGFSGGSVNGVAPADPSAFCNGTQFPPPAPGASGFYHVPHSVVDRVQVPDAPGDYVIQVRFDCEQTSQVWNNCGDLRIVRSGPAPPPQPSTPLYGCVDSKCVPVTTGGVEQKLCQRVCKGT